MMQASQIAFYILGVFAVLCGIGCISQRNPIAAAMWLVGTMMSLAAMYVILNAQFIGVIRCWSTPARSWCCSCS
jgi:NADH-quinone oxidoreductase subunit J